MRKSIFRLFGGLTFLGILFGIFSNFGYSQFVVPEHDAYVTDAAGIISDAEEEKLENLIYEVWQNTDVEMAVLFVNSLSGESAWYAGVQVGEERGVGDADNDNGVVILVSIGDRERTIQVGYGLEGTLTDAIAKRVGEANFPTTFRAGDYAGGVYSAIEEMYKYIQADPVVMAEYADSISANNTYDYTDTYDYSAMHRQERNVLFFVILGIVYFFSGFWLSEKYMLEKRVSKKKARKMKKDGWMNYLIIGLIFSAILSMLTSSFLRSIAESFLVLLMSMRLAAMPTSGGGSGGSSYKSGGYKSPSFSSSKSSSSISSSSSSSSSSGSSFGGFSGGSFGGGGSSGKR